MQVFFSFLGFETVASAAEETRNPPVDLPIGIIAALAACAGLYALMCVTIVGMVPWQEINIDTPFSSAYSDIGWTWAGKVVAIGALTGIVTSLLMSLFGQIRLLMCLGRERMLPARLVCRSSICFKHSSFRSNKPNFDPTYCHCRVYDLLQQNIFSCSPLWAKYSGVSGFYDRAILRDTGSTRKSCRVW